MQFDLVGTNLDGGKKSEALKVQYGAYGLLRESPDTAENNTPLCQGRNILEWIMAAQASVLVLGMPWPRAFFLSESQLVKASS